MTRTELPKRVAAIDVGTHTLRLVVGAVEGGKIVRITSGRSVTRLGKNLRATSLLDQESIERSITTLVSFKALSDACGAGEIFAVGTSALREALNSAEFLRSVLDHTGISIRVISGQEEADLTLKGIRGGMSDVKHPAVGKELVVDIGGGSTEWVLCDEQCERGSLPTGAVKLSEQFICHDPPHETELSEMEKAISECISKSLLGNLLRGLPEAPAGSGPRALPFIATGGTATTLAAVDMELEQYDGDRVHLHRITLPRLRGMFDRLAALPVGERRRVRGIEAERADIIIAGAALMVTFMEQVAAPEVIISDFGILEGLLLTHACGTMV